MYEINNGHWQRLGHCGNASPITGECMLGCDPGWCIRTPEAQQAETKRHREWFQSTLEQDPRAQQKTAADPKASGGIHEAT